MSAINKDGSLNISLLERQIHEDMAIYSKSRAEDGMKKKALHSSETFEKFQDFVSVSQLKPISDVSSLFNGGSGTVSSFRNRTVHGGAAAQKNGGSCLEGFVKDKKRAEEVVTIKAEMTESSNDETTRSSNKSSRDAYRFFARWKRQCASSPSSDKLLFLAEMEELPETICQQYFATDIDSDVVGDVVNAMHLLMRTVMDKSNARNDDATATTKLISFGLLNESGATKFMLGWLKAMTNCGRFDLALSFLTKEQALQLNEIVRFVTNSIYTDEADEASMHRYNKILKN